MKAVGQLGLVPSAYVSTSSHAVHMRTRTVSSQPVAASPNVAVNKYKLMHSRRQACFLPEAGGHREGVAIRWSVPYAMIRNDMVVRWDERNVSARSRSGSGGVLQGGLNESAAFAIVAAVPCRKASELV